MLKSVMDSDIFRSSMRDYGIEMLERYGREPEVSHEALVKKYTSWVYICVNVNSVAVASVPLRLYAARAVGQSRSKATAVPISVEQEMYLRRKSSLQNHDCLKTAAEIEEVVEHPLIDLLNSVNDFENRFETMELTNTMNDLTGNCYWFISNGPLGIPDHLQVLRSQWMTIVPDKKTFIKGYLYGRQYDKKIRLDPDEVVHFKYPNPHNPWYGMGPVQAAAYAVQRQNLMDRYESSTLENMGRPDIGIIYQKGRLKKEQRKELEQEWNVAFKGPDKAGKIKIMDTDFKVEKFGWSPKELEFLQGRPWTMKEIAASLNVPVGFLDTSEISKAPRAGMEGTDLFLAKYSTKPRCLRIEQKLNEKLVPKYDERLFVAFDNPVPEDRRFELLEETQQLKNWVITINEARIQRGMKPVPYGDAPLIPLNVAPLGSAPAESQEEQRSGASPVEATLLHSTALGESAGGVIVDGKVLHPDLAGVEIGIN